jgi:hypothetical protein
MLQALQKREHAYEAALQNFNGRNNKINSTDVSSHKIRKIWSQTLNKMIQFAWLNLTLTSFKLKAKELLIK